MPLNIDILAQSRTEIDGQWYIARPLPGPTISRWKDAWLVLKGKADAIVYGPYKPISDAPKGNTSHGPPSDYSKGREKT